MAISRTSAVSLLVFALAIGLCHGGQFKLSWTLCCATPTFTLPTVAPGSTAGFAGESSSSGSNIPEAQANAMKAQIAAQMGISVSQLCCLTLTSTDSGTMTLAVEVDEELTPPPLINATISDGTNTFITNGTQPRITEVESNGNNTTVIIIAVVFSVLGAILFAVMAYILYRKHKAEKDKEHGAMGSLQKPVARPTNDIPLTLTSAHGNTTTPTAPATLQRSDIADEKARYLWNAAANAVADPHPGGHPVAPKMAFVADELTS